MVKVAWVQGEGSCPSGDWGPGYVHRSEAVDLRGTTMQAPMAGKAQEPDWWTVQVRTAQAPQSPGSHCQDCAGAAEPRFPLPAPIHTSLPSAGMHHFRIRLRHPRNVPCFPWCVLWERRGNSHPRCRPHTWVAAGVDKPPCQLCPWSSGALAVQCHLPGKVA